MDLANFAIAIPVCVLLLVTDSVIAGATSIGYAVTRIPGEFYSLFQGYAVVLATSSLGVLIVGYIRAETLFVKIRILYLLIAVFFLTLPIFAAIALMTAGWKFNAAVILPVGTTLFLGFLTYAIKNDRLADPRFRLPFSRRYKLFKAMRDEFAVYRDGREITTRERKRNLEKIFIMKALLDYEGRLSQTEIAEKLGISPSSLSRKRKEYRI